MALVLAYYKHHERTLTADLESDLQLREIGIDPVLKMLTAYSEVLGTKIHGVTQESPSIAFAGSITIASTLGVTGTSTLGTVNASGQITSTLVSGNTTPTFLASSANPRYQLQRTDAATDEKNWTWTASTTQMQFNTRADDGTAGTAWLSATRSGNGVSAVTIVPPVSMSSTLGVTGVTTLSNRLVFGASTYSSGLASAYTTAADGLTVTGKTGSNFDMVLTNGAGSNFLTNTTGTTAVNFPGAVSMSSTLGVTGDVTASANIRIPASASGSLVGRPTSFNRGIAGWSGTSVFIGDSDEWTGMNFRVASGTFAFTGGAVTMASTLGVTGVITASSGLTLGGRFKDKTTTLTTTTTLDNTHSTVFVDSSGGSWTLTLPAASGNAGLTYTIIKIGPDSNTITIDGNGSETIAGDLTVVLGGDVVGSRLVLVCDGAVWYIKELYEEGTFTATLNGVSGTVTGTAYYVRNGSSITIQLPMLSGTSNATTFGFSGIPARIRPTADVQVGKFSFLDNGTRFDGGEGYLQTDGFAVFMRNGSATGWTNTGTKAITGAGGENHTTAFSYMII